MFNKKPTKKIAIEPAVATQPKPQIPTMLAAVRRELAKYQANTEVLEARLASVMRPGEVRSDGPKPALSSAAPVAEALSAEVDAWPCESCGKPCDERHRPYWAPELKVGICCALHSDEWLNDTEPTCDELFKLIATCISVAEVSAIMESHAHSGCLRCTPRKEAQSDSKPGQKRRAA